MKVTWAAWRGSDASMDWAWAARLFRLRIGVMVWWLYARRPRTQTSDLVL